MMAEERKETPLPMVRPDLEFIPGADAADGSPTMLVYDPLARSYDRFSWVETTVIRQLLRPVTLEQVMERLKQKNIAGITREGVLQVCATLVQCGLTTNTLHRSPEELEEEKRRQTPGMLKWLLHHYLYFRIPLLRPDAFLEKTLGYVRPFASKPAFFFYFCLSFIGLLLVFMSHERFFHTFQYFFNLKGILLYGLAITLIKVVHEFSHAYTAKARGVRVPVMGVAFIVMWPVAFCDVTDGWRIPRRMRRLPIAAAGILAELIIAGISLFCWSLCSPGIMQSIFFVVCTASLLSTLLININPAMSFDGYYMFMDISGVDNIRPRAFAYTHYLFRRYCAGMELIPPEAVSRGRRTLYCIYSIYAWLYRFFLYLSIAALVYYEFTKVLGIILFCVEVGWFIIMPVVSEMITIYKMREYIRINRFSVTFSALLLTATLLFVMPRSHSYYVPAVGESESIQLLYAPFAGVITSLDIERGQQVKRGDKVAELASAELNAALGNLKVQQRIDATELQLLFLRNRVEQIPAKNQQKLETESRLASLANNARQYQLYCAIDGVVAEWDMSLRSGDFVRKDQVFGRIIDPRHIYLAAYVPEERIFDVAVGDRVLFYASDGAKGVAGTVRLINGARVESIPYPALTSEQQGDIPVVNTNGRFEPLEARYLVEVELENTADLQAGQSGALRMKSLPSSTLGNLWNRAYRVMIRESNF